MKNAFSVVLKLFRITLYVNDFQTLNNHGSGRCLEKLVLPSIFDTSLSFIIIIIIIINVVVVALSD